MRVDKFGIGSLVIGIIIIVAMLQFVFMTPAVCGADGGWCWNGLANAVVVAVEGGVLLLGLLLAIIGLLLLVL